MCLTFFHSCVYVHGMHVWCPGKSEIGHQDPLELESRVVVIYHVWCWELGPKSKCS